MDSVSGIRIGGYDNSYARIASGRKLLSASDGAAGLSIAKRENVQSDGYEVGAKNAADGTNALEKLQNYNYSSSYNHTASASKLEDTDYPQAVEKLKRKQALQAYALTMQKRREDDSAKRTRALFQ